MTEAHLGQLAQNRASGSDIRDFGRTLMETHKNAYSRLQAIAQSDLKKAIDNEHQQVVRRFENVWGTQFDQESGST